MSRISVASFYTQLKDLMLLYGKERELLFCGDLQKGVFNLQRYYILHIWGLVLRYVSKDQLLSKLPLNHIHMKLTV